MEAEMERAAQEINASLAEQSWMRVGCVVAHPDGHKGRVLSGAFLDPVYGRVTNTWTWGRVFDDGAEGEIETGFGW